jgi:hypothetical protein
MLKKIWQSLVRWFRKLVGRGTSSRSRDRLATAPLPPLDDTDREYLFMQLLEGVAHGWQQPRAIGFFNKIRNRVRKSEWLDWLDRFGQNLLDSPVPNYELAGRMSQLSQLDCGEVGDLAGEYATRLLDRQAEEYPMEFLPIMEFNSSESELLTIDSLHEYDRANDYAEVPPELLIDRNPPPPQPQRSFQSQGEEDSSTETREITLEEFAAMLHKDPSLVAELAEQFGIETTDPQAIVSAVIAQMQQQVQPISGDLSATSGDLSATPDEPIVPPATPPTPPEIPTPPTPPETPTPPTPPEIPAPSPPTTPPAPPEIPTPPAPSARSEQMMPPPPPSRRLEYKTEDPWVAPVPTGEAALSETAKSIANAAAREPGVASPEEHAK